MHKPTTRLLLILTAGALGLVSLRLLAQQPVPSGEILLVYPATGQSVAVNEATFKELLQKYTNTSVGKNRYCIRWGGVEVADGVQCASLPVPSTESPQSPATPSPSPSPSPEPSVAPLPTPPKAVHVSQRAAFSNARALTLFLIETNMPSRPPPPTVPPTSGGKGDAPGLK